MIRQLDWGIPAQQDEMDLPRADDVRIRDVAPVIRAAGNGVELAPMLGVPACAAGGGPVFNVRSEGGSSRTHGSACTGASSSATNHCAAFAVARRCTASST